eukprot:scaffold21236_cov61-Phaeocystis_antarctica.AAC.3
MGLLNGRKPLVRRRFEHLERRHVRRVHRPDLLRQRDLLCRMGRTLLALCRCRMGLQRCVERSSLALVSALRRLHLGHELIGHGLRRVLLLSLQLCQRAPLSW